MLDPGRTEIMPSAVEVVLVVVAGTMVETRRGEALAQLDVLESAPLGIGAAELVAGL